MAGGIKKNPFALGAWETAKKVKKGEKPGLEITTGKGRAKEVSKQEDVAKFTWSIVKGLAELVKADPNNKKFVAELLERTTIVRSLTPWVGTSIDFTEGFTSEDQKGATGTGEHVKPVNETKAQIYSIIDSFVAESNPAKADAEFNKNVSDLLRNYMMIQLAKIDDNILDRHYHDILPSGTSAEDGASLIRYVNENTPIDSENVYLWNVKQTLADYLSPDSVNKARAELQKKYPGYFTDLSKEQQNIAIVKALTTDLFDAGLSAAIYQLSKGDKFFDATIGLPIAALRGGLHVVQKAYRAGKGTAKAISKGYQWLKDEGYKVEFQKWKDYVNGLQNRAYKNNYGKELTIVEQFDKERKEAADKVIKQDKIGKIDQLKHEDDQRNIQKLVDKITKGKKVASEFVAKKLGAKAKKWSLVPSKADDFEGLMYALYGKGDEIRNQNKKYLYDPFERGDNAAIHHKNALLDGLKNVKRQYGVSRKYLSRSTGIKIGGQEISNGQLVRLYLHSVFNQDKIGLSNKQIKRITDFIESDPKLLPYAQAIPKIYNATNKLTGEIGIPIALDSNGEVDITQGTVETDLLWYTQKKLRPAAFKEFIENADVMFSKENMRALRAKFGNEWADSVENILKRMKSGRNRSIEQDRYHGKMLDWVNGSQAVIMFGNLRSGLLQLTSTLNYVKPSDIKYYAKMDKANLLKTAKMLWNTPYLKERRRAVKSDIHSEELVDKAFSASKWETFVGRTAQVGFIPTKTVDSLAIALGGAIFYNARRAEGLSHSDALLAWQAETEKAQQSSRPDRISAQQASAAGRLLLAFANTPIQYFRLIEKAASDIKNKRGNLADNAGKILYYGAIQTVLFTTLQQALTNILFDDDEEWDESEKRRLEYGINGMIDTLLRGTGLIGNAISAVKNAAWEVHKQAGKKRPDWWEPFERLISISPPIGSKIGKLKDAANRMTWNARHIGTGTAEDPLYYASANTISAITNMPSDWIYKKLEAAREIHDNEWGLLNELMRLTGWTKSQLKVEDSSKSKGPKSYNVDYNKKYGKDYGKKYDSPYNRGETGQAFRDGTIEVDPNQSPLEQQKTIAHEKQHVKDMQEKGLDYDDDFVYYDGQQFARKAGKIELNGNMLPEGDPKLPWEKRAYEAESPLKQTGDEDDPDHDHYETMREKEAGLRKHSQKYAKKYGLEDKSIQDIRWVPEESTAPGAERFGGTQYRPRFVGHAGDFEEAHGDHEFEAAKQWTKDWESNPITIAKDIARTGATEEELAHSLERQHKAQYQAVDSHDSTAATYNPESHTIRDNPKFKGAEGYSKEGVLAHEFAHGGRDLERGLHAQEILGRVGQGLNKEYESYVNRPHELYGFLQQLRHESGLKPGDDLTEKQIQQLKKKGSKNPLLNADVKKLIEANKKVAYQEPPNTPCLLYTSPSPRDRTRSRMPSSA